MKSEQLEDKLSDKEAYAKIHRKIRIYVILSLLGMFFVWCFFIPSQQYLFTFTSLKSNHYTFILFNSKNILY